MRSISTYRQLFCHSCKREFSGMVYQYSADWTGPKELPSCVCTNPHIEVLPRPGTTALAQVRSSQRAVFYELPDGSLIAPETNSYADPGAVAAVQRGAIRREIHSIHEMRRLHNEHQPGSAAPGDWGSDRNLVLDYDQPTIRSGSANHPLRQYTQEEVGPQHNPFQQQHSIGSTMHIIPGGDFYERARDEYVRRGRG